RVLPLCPQAARRPHPPRAGRDATRRTCPPAQGRPSGPFPRQMPTQEPPKTRGLKTSVSRPLCQPQAGAYRARPKKIVFEDELPSRPVLGTKKPVGSILGRHMPRPHSLPDYELKYPAVSSERERSRYVAVFQDQHAEFLELQQEVGSAQAKLQQLEALLTSLPAPRSQVSSQMETPTPQPFQVAGSGLHLITLLFLPLQKEAQVTAHVWREFEKKQMDPSFLDKQARCRYLKSKLRHLKAQIQKFDDRGDSEGSVYF
uniref:Occludin/ELL domain containing 1 n=1 Tax=Rhinolophus ferrumequinum TaxID=59479 RepID=A0A671FDQ1_RHIFE